MSKSAEVVVEGAKIKCTMGDISNKLIVTNQFKYRAKKKKIATMFDFMPGVNMMPPVGTFGTCKPYKALPPPASLCTPIPVMPWSPAFTKKKVGMKPVIKANACLMCARGGGVIKFENSGQ